MSRDGLSSLLCAFVRVEFVCFLPSIHSGRFGQLLCCAHKRIVNIMKVYIDKKNVDVELIRFRDFIDFAMFEVDLFFRYTCAHWYPRRVATIRF